ncbi:hypothetical protein E2C01_077596 [Portunus trituberculatus]|uniref:Uncharacterized protein n=1 Tax=Portunus trituberculatus TaxID=210409 RepID=A0A5B7IMH9_PORTR|nr:hypothetical protein [Portunus trituberculatus]
MLAGGGGAAGERRTARSHIHYPSSWASSCHSRRASRSGRRLPALSLNTNKSNITLAAAQHLVVSSSSIAGVLGEPRQCPVSCLGQGATETCRSTHACFTFTRGGIALLRQLHRAYFIATREGSERGSSPSKNDPWVVIPWDCCQNLLWSEWLREQKSASQPGVNQTRFLTLNHTSMAHSLSHAGDSHTILESSTRSPRRRGKCYGGSSRPRRPQHCTSGSPSSSAT